MTYMGCKLPASPNLHGAAFYGDNLCGMLPYMDRKPTYLRAWRLKRGYTQDDMLGRLEVLGVSITGASLSRIERGLQPYSQDVIEAIATALDVTVAQLLEHNPDLPGSQVIDFVAHLTAKEQAQAESVLRAMFPERASH